MTLKDRLRLLYAKILQRETILFSKVDAWEKPIKRTLENATLFFYEFDEVNPKNFDLIIPLSLRAQKYSNAHPGLLSPRQAIIPSDHCIDLCNNKESFYKFLVNNNFGMFAPKINTDLDFPYILKKRIGVWGLDILIIYNSQDEQKNLEKIQSDDYFKQELIPGKNEYASHVIMANKKIVFLKTVKYTFQENYFVYGKYHKPTTSKEVDHSHFMQLFEDILIAMDFQGICCFDYKIVNQDLMIFELNPRYGGSLIRFLKDALQSYRNAISHA